jgi:hypothetical protein
MKDFVPYQEALALKELGFDEPCVAFYEEFKRLSIGFNWLNEGGKNSNLQECNAPLYQKAFFLHHYGLLSAKEQVLAPLYQQAFRWFREKYELYSFVFKFDEGFGYETYKEGVTQTNESFDTYEEAELACLKKLIDLTKD